MVLHECISVYDWSDRRWRGSSFVCSCVVGISESMWLGMAGMGLQLVKGGMI
jgi:hypothetical protein